MGPRGRREAPRGSGPPASEVAHPLSGAHVTRRDVLKYGSILSALGLIELKRPHGLLQIEKARAQGASVLTATVTRPDDMLSLDFEFINLALQGPPAKLVKTGGIPYIVVRFGPQAVGEEAIFESTAAEPPPSPPVRALLAGDTRLAFIVPASIDEIPFELGGLLDWDQFLPSVVENASTPPENEAFLPVLAEPQPTQTAIEAPWRLIMSPQDDVGWDHSPVPIERGGRVELWHTRVDPPSREPGGPRGQIPETGAEMRAIWATGFKRDVKPSDSNSPFRMSLKPLDRWEFVRLTSDFRIQGYTPRPVRADRFALSALGAFIDLRGNWNPPTGFDRLHWTHRSTLGRDQFVRVITRGFLFPYGHAAVLITVTERKFQTIKSGAQAGKTGAFLRQRKFVVVKEPIKAYDSRDFPFQSVEVKTLSTPDLNKPEDDALVGTESAFWMRAGAGDVPFHLVAIDQDDNEIEYTTPLVFIAHSTANTTSGLFKVVTKYAGASADRRRRPLQGQKVAYAPGTTPGLGDGALETERLEIFGLGATGGGVPFRPALRNADVRLQAVEQVKGSGLPDGVTIEYHPAYTAGGFDGSEIFARLKKPVDLDYGASGDADRSGGVATPNMTIRGLSRKLGPVGNELSGAGIPAFDPQEFFKGAKILGGIDLADVLAVTVGFEDAPQLVSKSFPDRIETSLVWNVPEGKLNKDHPLVEWESGARIEINALFVTPLDGSEPDFKITGDIRKFSLHLLARNGAFLIVRFNRLTFEAVRGKKPDVDVDIRRVEFAGILSFVNELRKFLDSSGTGLSIDVTPTQIQAGYTLPIPDIAVGVFSLKNISLGAAVTIPFTGKAISTSFAFARRDSMFQVTYTVFGGGGYFEITVGEDDEDGTFGIQLLEAAIEFGGSASIDIGVASGGIHLMAGIYFAMGSKDGCKISLLEGYVRLGGELDILGVVSVSLEFKMSLSFDFETGEVWGQATLVIEVDVLMFSESVELTVEKRFAGSGSGGDPGACAPSSGKLALPSFLADGDPVEPVSFGELITQTEWTSDYAAAFAVAEFA